MNAAHVGAHDPAHNLRVLLDIGSSRHDSAQLVVNPKVPGVDQRVVAMFDCRETIRRTEQRSIDIAAVEFGDGVRLIVNDHALQVCCRTDSMRLEQDIE